jgi:hypothetical protein
MSLGVGQIRKNATVQSRFRKLVDAVARGQAVQLQVDTLDFQGWQRMSSDRLKMQDPFFYGKEKTVRLRFFTPKEPDLQFMVLALKLDHVGRFIEDWSGFGQDGVVHGQPKLKLGIDTGFGGSVYCDFNGTTDWVDVPDSLKLRSTAADSGFSLSFRLYPRDISDPGVNKFRKIICKNDSKAILPVTDGYSCSVLPDGRIRFTCMVDGVNYSVQSAPGVIVPNATAPVAHEIALEFLGPGTVLNSRLTLINGNITVNGFTGGANVAANVNDDNVFTIWSYTGLPAWIKVDLGALKRISRVGIHWYRYLPPTSMIFGFNIETSPDNTVWTKRLPVGTGNMNSASHVATQMEYYDLTPNVDARYVRVNVVSVSGTIPAFAAMRELQVWGSDTPGLPGAAQTQAIWVNNIKYTTTTSTHDDIPTDAENQIHIARGSTELGTDYKFIGGIHDLRYWKNYLYTDTEVTNLHTNKQTVWNIPLGSVALAGYTLILAESEDYGFVDDGYDTAGVLAD